MKLIVQDMATGYEDKGKGKVLLFLHGWKDDRHSLDAVSRELKSKFRIISLDLPGFGETELPPSAWEVGDYSNFVADFIKKLDLDVYALIGHSFGGRICIKGLSDAKLSAEKLVLIGSAGLSKKRSPKTVLLKILAKIGGALTFIPPLIFFRKQIKNRIYKLIGSDYLSAGPLKETFKKVISEDLTSNAELIKIPTLLIWGENDNSTPLEDGKRFNKLIKNSKLEVIQNAGHFVHIEKPDKVQKIIKDFLC